ARPTPIATKSATMAADSKYPLVGATPHQPTGYKTCRMKSFTQAKKSRRSSAERDPGGDLERHAGLRLHPESDKAAAERTDRGAKQVAEGLCGQPRRDLSGLLQRHAG